MAGLQLKVGSNGLPIDYQLILMLMQQQCIKTISQLLEDGTDRELLGLV
jgi:hypothetical protein